MKSHKVSFYFSLILLIGLLGFDIGNTVYAFREVSTDIGPVDAIYKNKNVIIIDDLSYRLATKADNIKKGDYVKVVVDARRRVIEIQKIDNPQKSKKDRINQSIQSAKSSTKKSKSVRVGSKIKKVDGVWRNY